MIFNRNPENPEKELKLLGGMSNKKLWQNASSTSTFKGQTVTLIDAIENYTYWFITFKYWYNHTTIRTSGLFPVGQNISIDSSYDYTQHREVSISGNKATISDNNRTLNWGSTALDHNDQGMIPVAIYGVKGGQ